MDTEDKTEVFEKNVEEEVQEIEAEVESPNSEDLEQFKKQKKQGEDLIGNYKGLVEKENQEKDEIGTSSVVPLREMFENYGMHFLNSNFNDSVIVLNSKPGEADKKEHRKDILGTMDDQEILEWSSEHYKDYVFAVFLAVCILDCQVYEDILQMGNELQDILRGRKNEEASDGDNWNYKSKMQETLGLIEYRDRIYVRGLEQETDFLRLPSHEQSGYYIRLFIKEFPNLKLMLGPYLVSKIFDTCKNKRNYLIVGGCTEALANIGNEDVVFFNVEILPLFFRKRTTEADYCLAMLLKQMYLMEQNREYVIKCAEQWGRITSNPHYPLTVLYLCGMLKNQEDFVWGVWDLLLNTLMKEIIDGRIFAENSYYVNLLEFFRSGNRELSYYKGVVHAFYNKIKKMRKERKREEVNILGSLFLMFVLNDYGDCDLSGKAKRKRGMLWVEIVEQMDSRTGPELVFLWKQALNHRQYPREGWNILRMYLDKYESWNEGDLRKLSFFFYRINQSLNHDQAYAFLKKCMSKEWGGLQIAEKIYERIEKENRHER